MPWKCLVVCAIVCLPLLQPGCGDDPDKKPKDKGTPATQPAESELEKAMDASLKARTRIAALLKTVKDVDSAKAIVPLLQTAVAEENKLTAAISKMPAPTPAEDKVLEAKFGTRLQSTTAALKLQRARMEAMPEVLKIIGPVLDEE